MIMVYLHTPLLILKASLMAHSEIISQLYNEALIFLVSGGFMSLRCGCFCFITNYFHGFCIYFGSTNGQLCCCLSPETLRFVEVSAQMSLIGLFIFSFQWQLFVIPSALVNVFVSRAFIFMMVNISKSYNSLQQLRTMICITMNAH